MVGELRKDITGHIDDVLKDIRSQYRDLESELFRLVERRFAEVAGRLDAVASDTRSRMKGEFRFASEKSSDEVVELPNPFAAGKLN